MFRALRHPIPVLFIVGLMALVVVPKRWLHECDMGFHAHSSEGSSVVEDGHCPLCETVIPAPVLSAPAMLFVPVGTVEEVCASDVRQVLDPTRLFALVRGPPCLG